MKTDERMGIVELYERRFELNKSIKEKHLELEKLQGLMEEADDHDLIKEYGESYEMAEKAHMELKDEHSYIHAEIMKIKNTTNKIIDNLPNHRPGIGKTDKEKQAEYLASKEALIDFVDVLHKNRTVDNSATRRLGNTGQATSNHIRDNINNQWLDKMREKGITNPELLAPNAVVERISDAFASAGVIYNKVSKFETLDPWEQIFNIDMSDTAGAQVYSLAKIAANGADKTEQTQILVSKTVNPEIIYKYLPVPNRYSRYNANRTVLMQYLLGELPRRIVYALEKYIVLGDPDFITQTGGATQSVQFPNTTTPTSVPTTTNIIGFEGITQANPAFCWTIESSGDLYEDVINAMTWISYPGRKTLITSAAQVAGLRTMKDSQGQLVYPFNVDLTQAFDVDEIETPQWFPLPANPGDLVAVVVVLPAYKVIGDLAIEQFTNFLLATNTDQYLAETFQGGALLELQSAVAITMASTTPTP